jgi:hypothetical protein
MKTNNVKAKKRNLEFRVRAKNNVSFEKIKKKAQLFGIKFYTKGKARQRLYFFCSEKVWSFFSLKIRKYCIFNSPVECPSWVKKRIVANLLKAATSSFSSQRRDRAQAIFKSIGPNSVNFHQKMFFEASFTVWTLTKICRFAATSSFVKLRALFVGKLKPKRTLSPITDISTGFQLTTN